MSSTFLEQAEQNGFVTTWLREKVGRHAYITLQAYRAHETLDNSPIRRIVAFKATHVDGVDSPLFVFPIPERPRYQSKLMWMDAVRTELEKQWKLQTEERSPFVPEALQTLEAPIDEAPVPVEAPSAPVKKGRGRPRKV